MSRRLGAVLAVGLLLPAQDALHGQIRLEDLLFTGGISAEGYRGNFSAVTVPIVDSTNAASAAVGEFGARGWALLYQRPQNEVQLHFDAGMRQFAATGFQLRDYAPRELSTQIDLMWLRSGAAGQFSLFGGYRGRGVEDRPPLPLFLQPGYSTFSGGASYRLRPIQGVAFHGAYHAERVDYRATGQLSQLDLLDRRTHSFDLEAVVGSRDEWSVTFLTAFRRSDYPQQPSFAPDDPFRRDRAVTLGVEWQLATSVLANLGIQGTVNRSNSQRPEYDAVSVQGELAVPLPLWELTVHAFSVLTWKSYVIETQFARLVPGEEADNASLVSVDLVRPLAANLDGVLRFGWTRAETDIGESYYRRFGTTFLLNFRPIF